MAITESYNKSKKSEKPVKKFMKYSSKPLWVMCDEYEASRKCLIDDFFENHIVNNR
jgi:hypothetical protein